MLHYAKITIYGGENGRKKLDKAFISKIKSLTLPDSEGLSYVILKNYGKARDVLAVYDFKQHALRDDRLPLAQNNELFEKINKIEVCKENKPLFLVALAEFYVNGADGLKNLEGEFTLEQVKVITKALDEAVLLKNSVVNKQEVSLAARPEVYNLDTLREWKKKGTEILNKHGIK